MGWEGKKSLISFILGIIIGILGFMPLFGGGGAFSTSLSGIPEIILMIILLIGASYLVVNGVMEVAMYPKVGWVSILSGSLIAIAIFLKILGKFSTTLGFLEGTFLNILFIVVGFLLFIGAFMF